MADLDLIKLKYERKQKILEQKLDILNVALKNIFEQYKMTEKLLMYVDDTDRNSKYDMRDEYGSKYEFDKYDDDLLSTDDLESKDDLSKDELPDDFSKDDDLSTDDDLPDDLSTDDDLFNDDDLLTDDLFNKLDTKTNEVDLESAEYTSQFTKSKHGSVIYPNIDIPTNVEDYIDAEITNFVTLHYCYFAIDTRSIKPFVVYGVRSIEKSPSQYYPEYLSEKQKDLSNNVLSFLSITIDLNKEPDISSHLDKDGVYIGYIPHKTKPDHIYLLYKVKSPENIPGKRATINELCNLKAIGNKKIDTIIDDLFMQNKELLHIFEKDSEAKIEVPFSGYLCDVDDVGNLVNTNTPIDNPLVETDVLKIGLKGEYYYLTSKPLNEKKPTERYVIFVLNATNYDKTISDYDEYNSIYYAFDDQSVWAIKTIKQISKI
jgi:hypothetical protein